MLIKIYRAEPLRHWWSEMYNDFKYFIHIGRVLKWGIEGGGCPITHKNFFYSSTKVS